jgi:photosystem II stability/assembly factor-like uncharacterized protein
MQSSTAVRRFASAAAVFVFAACSTAPPPTAAPPRTYTAAQLDAHQWRKLETEAYRGKQDDIYFVTPQVGWYVNGLGKIFKTTDGGKTWTMKLHKPGTYFRCIAFIDSQRGFAGNIGPDYYPNVSDTVPLYETRDGGDTWTAVTNIKGPMPKGLCAIEVVREPFINAGVLDEKVRVVAAGRVGGPTYLMQSSDSGDSWTSTDMSAQCGMILDVKFLDNQNGIISAGTSAKVDEAHALILRTSDGGKTWAKVYESTRPYEITWKSSFPTRQDGFVTIQSYNPDKTVTQRYVAHTSDGGRTWRELPLVNDFAVREFGIAFLTPQVGWVGTSTTGFETRDGGATWKPVNLGRAVNKIRLLPDGDGFVGYAIGVEVFKLGLSPES